MSLTGRAAGRLGLDHLAKHCSKMSYCPNRRFLFKCARGSFLGKLFRMWPRSPYRGFWNGCGRQPYYCGKVSIVIRLVTANFPGVIAEKPSFFKTLYCFLTALAAGLIGVWTQKKRGTRPSPESPACRLYRCRSSCRKVATVCSIAAIRRSRWSRSSNVLSIAARLPHV